MINNERIVSIQSTLLKHHKEVMMAKHYDISAPLDGVTPYPK